MGAGRILLGDYLSDSATLREMVWQDLIPSSACITRLITWLIIIDSASANQKTPAHQ
jgi:hypothetical protein